MRRGKQNAGMSFLRNQTGEEMSSQLTMFTAKVKAMRTAQKEYFRTRESGPLSDSKKLEAEVDGMVKAIESGAPFQEQGRL